jgi:hypothetical protein
MTQELTNSETANEISQNALPLDVQSKAGVVGFRAFAKHVPFLRDAEENPCHCRKSARSWQRRR